MNWYGIYGMLPTDKSKKKLAQFQNNLEFQNTFNQLVNMALDIFEWSNLPETCDPRMIETALLWRGYCAFYKDKNGVIWSYSAGPGGELTKYGYPNKGYLYALNGTTEQCKFYWPFMDNSDADGVLCLDNKLGYPMINYIIRGAERIADARRALDVAAQNSKRPYIFAGTEEQVNTIKELYNDIANNQPYLIVDENNINGIKPIILNTNANSTPIKDLWSYYLNTKSDVLQSIGINVNQNTDKKERMTTTEVRGDLELTEKQQDYRLEERQAFCDRVNEAFGLNISVDYKYDPVEEIKELMAAQSGMVGGNDNEQDSKSDDN